MQVTVAGKTFKGGGHGIRRLVHGVADHDFELVARNPARGVDLVHRHLRPVDHFLPVGGRTPGQGRKDPDLRDLVLRKGASRAQRRRGHEADLEQA